MSFLAKLQARKSGDVQVYTYAAAPVSIAETEFQAKLRKHKDEQIAKAKEAAEAAKSSAKAEAKEAADKVAEVSASDDDKAKAAKGRKS